jgi:hypothetical protein
VLQAVEVSTDAALELLEAGALDEMVKLLELATKELLDTAADELLTAMLELTVVVAEELGVPDVPPQPLASATINDASKRCLFMAMPCSYFCLSENWSNHYAQSMCVENLGL